jgi:hypothetical protein
MGFHSLSFLSDMLIRWVAVNKLVRDKLSPTIQCDCSSADFLFPTAVPLQLPPHVTVRLTCHSMLAPAPARPTRARARIRAHAPHPASAHQRPAPHPHSSALAPSTAQLPRAHELWGSSRPPLEDSFANPEQQAAVSARHCAVFKSIFLFFLSHHSHD